MNGPQVLIQIAKSSEMMFMALAETLKQNPLLRPCEGGNHAMWCVGHAVVSDHGMLQMVAGKTSPLPEWDELFKYGTTPTDDASAYPAYDKVLDAFAQSRAALVDHLSSLTDTDLDTKTQGLPEEWEPLFGTHGKALSMVCWHPQQHAGQLSVIRKVLGMAPAMA